MPAGVDVPPLNEPRERELNTGAKVLGVTHPDLALVVHFGLQRRRAAFKQCYGNSKSWPWQIGNLGQRLSSLTLKAGYEPESKTNKQEAIYIVALIHSLFCSHLVKQSFFYSGEYL